MKRAVIAAALLLVGTLGASAGAPPQRYWGQSASANIDQIIAQSDPSGRLRQRLRHGGFAGMLSSMVGVLPTEAQSQAMYRWSRIHDPVGHYVFDDDE